MPATNLLRPTPVSTDRFTYIPATNTFVAEASELPAMSRVFNDACDVGYTLISQRTGREVIFAVTGIERDREGELLYEDLRPVNPNEWAAGTVRVYND
jgi:hypothetical protein